MTIRAIDTMPELTGRLGRAWNHDITAVLKRIRCSGGYGPPPQLTVASWLLEVPYAHPFWSFYWLCCVSLQEIDGWPPAVLYLANATHEVMIYALCPDEDPLIDDRPAILLPGNFHGQFIETSDAAAEARMRSTVQDVLDGKLNPDTDARQQWCQRFGDNLYRPELRGLH